jgi:hypothetical protein
MTALLFSLALLAYVIVPGILFRRIFHVCVPLKRIQWSRTDELASFVVTLVVPSAVAYALVHWTFFFGHYPFGFADDALLKWNDYKNVLSASYSEKYFDENREQLLLAFERICRRQLHFLSLYYFLTVFWALFCGILAWQYGNIRRIKWAAFIVEKLMVPAVSEWHAMFTPFTFPHSPKRSTQVDALSSDGILYQGIAGLFHVGSDGKLGGFFLKGAKRFLRAEYVEAKKLDSSTPKDKYWRAIPGETFYLPSDKIINLNFQYVPNQPLDTLAEDNLKRMKIDATVVIQPASTPVTAKVDSQAQQQSKPEATSKTLGRKDFFVCSHCILNGRPGFLPRVTRETPIISRSDGRSYHIYLQYGPTTQSLSAGGAAKRFVYLTHFRYALDVAKLMDEPVIVGFNESQSPSSEEIGRVADKLEEILKQGKSPARFYKWGPEGLTEIPTTGRKKKR